MLDDSRAPFYRWFAGGALNTCYNALDRHVERGRGEQLALIYDSPVTGTDSDVHLPRAARRGGAVRRRARALRASSKGDRVIIYMPMVPEAVIAMLACARLGAIHSVVFGGFAAHELATRIDDATAEGDRLGLLRHRAGARRRLQAAARRGDRAGRRRSPSAASSCSGRSSRPSSIAGRDLDWDEAVAPARAGATACRSRRPIRSTSSTPRARPASRRASCATTAATPSRCLDDAARLRRRAGRGVLGGLRRRLGRRPLLHRLRAAAARLHDGALRGQAGRHARRRRVLARDRASTACRRCSPRRRRSARSSSRIPRASSSAATTSRGFRALFLAGERCDPDTLALGRGAAAACR